MSPGIFFEPDGHGSRSESVPPCTSQAEKKEEARKRGDANTYTTDAKFDERFKLGYGLIGNQVGEPSGWGLGGERLRPLGHELIGDQVGG